MSEHTRNPVARPRGQPRPPTGDLTRHTLKIAQRCIAERGHRVTEALAKLGTEGTFHGYDGLARSGREAFEVFRDLHWMPIRLIDGGDHVVATVEARGYGKHSDVEVNERVAHVWTLRGGRIVAWHVYMDPTEALEAAGLSEQDAHADS